MGPNAPTAITWKGMPVNAALDNLDAKLNASMSNTQRALDLANSVSATAAGTKYLAEQYDKQSQVTQKLLKELIDEFNDYKEEFKKLSEHCDELEQEVKDLREQLENSSIIELEEIKKKVKDNGQEWPQPFPTRWEPVKINWIGTGEDGNTNPWPGTSYEITCKANVPGTVPPDPNAVKDVFKAVGEDRAAAAAAF